MSDMADFDQELEQMQIEPRDEQDAPQEAPAITEDVLVIGDEEFSPDSDEDDAEQPEDEEIDGQPAPNWVKDLRKSSKETKRTLKQREAENEELRQRLQAIEQQKNAQPVQQKVISEPVRPTLEGSDWDEAAYQVAMDKYADDRMLYNRQVEQRKAADEANTTALRGRLESYQQKRQTVTLKGFAQAEAKVINSLPIATQNLLVSVVDDNPELVVYALGLNPKLMEAVKNEQDPLRLAAMLGSISAKARVAPRTKQRAESEPQVRGGGASTHHLEKLHQQAQTSGDWTEYFSAKRKTRS